MRPLVLAAALAGVILLAVMVLSASPDAVLANLSAGAVPVAAVSLYRMAPLSLYALSWRALIPPASRPRILTVLRLRWIGESVNALLPVAQVGGDFVRARLLMQSGVSGAAAGASMIADIGIGVATQIPFTVAGVIGLALHGAVGEQLVRPIAFVCVLTAAGAGALLAVAHIGVSRISRVFGQIPIVRRRKAATDALFEHASEVDQSLIDLGTRRGDLARAFLWHLVGWFSQTAETWLILRLIGPGRGVSWLAALVIESLTLTARSAAFIVPGGLGVQEGALVLVGARYGVDPTVALSLGIIKRMRELVVGAPAVVAWSIAERGLIEKLWRRTFRRENRVRR